MLEQSERGKKSPRYRRATLIAAAVADNFDAPRAWVIVGFVAAAYIVSRGLAKVGTAHRDPDESTRRN